ncbi:hypothetical protein ACTGZQ_04100 [Streptococcus suis]
MKLKKITLISLALLVSCGFIVYEIYKSHIQNELSAYQVSGVYSGQAKLDAIYKMEQAALVAKWDVTSNQLEYDLFTDYFKIEGKEFFPVILSEKYLVRQNIKVQSNFGYQKKFLNNGEYWTIDIYDLQQGGQKVAQYDVYDDIVKEESTAGISPIVYSDAGGNEYLLFFLENENKEEYFRLLDIATGEIIDIEEQKIENGKLSSYSYQITPYKDLMLWTNIEKKISEQNLLVTWRGSIGITYSGTVSRDADNWKLAKIDNTSYDLFKQGGIVYLTSSNLEETLEVFELFFESSEELYEGLIINEHNSTDGQSHTVQTKEEFLRYFKQTEEVSE